jgi:hypothetical protein
MMRRILAAHQSSVGRRLARISAIARPSCLTSLSLLRWYALSDLLLLSELFALIIRSFDFFSLLCRRGVSASWVRCGWRLAPRLVGTTSLRRATPC